MSGLKFPKEETKKKGCPIRPAFSEAEKEDVTCADGTYRLKNIIFLADLTEHYPNNTD